ADGLRDGPAQVGEPPGHGQGSHGDGRGQAADRLREARGREPASPVSRRPQPRGKARTARLRTSRGRGPAVRGARAGVRARDSRLSADLVAANRILAELGVLDGYGHVSARDERDPARYLLARARAPELVSADDLVEHDLDSQPLAPESRPLYTERF